MKALISLLFLPFMVFSQTVSETLSSAKISGITAEMVKSSDPSRDDMYFVFLSFRNEKYTTISDLCVIGLSDSSELAQIISDLEYCVEFLDSGNNGKSVSLKHSKYMLQIYDFSRELYIHDPTGRKYISIEKRWIEKLIEYLKSLEFP